MVTMTAPTPVRIGPEGLPARTLGWEILGWTADYLLQPDGPNAEQPWNFTDEQTRFVLWWYAIDESGRFLHRSGVLRRMKGWGKDPVAAALCAIEFVGPCRFGGWDGENPIAVPHPAAWIQTAAVAKEQTRNTMTLFPGMLSRRAIEEYEIDLGKEIIYAHHGRRRIEAVTSSPRTLEGGRPTFVLKNETQHWLANNDGHEMSEVIARNAAKARDGGARVLAITNAHRLGEGAVAELDWRAWEQTGPGGDILYDSLEAPAETDIDDDDSLLAGLECARGDSHWLDLPGILAEIRDPRTSESLARRYYLNQIRSDRDSWLTPAEWEACRRDYILPDGAKIVIGFDGSRFRDATALVATDIATGWQAILGVWTRVEDDPNWEVPAGEVGEVVAEAFRRYDVWRLYADPYWWEDTIAQWSARWGERVAFWPTNRLGAMARAVNLPIGETAANTAASN